MEAAKRPQKAVLIGGGKASREILELVVSGKLKVFSLEIMAVVDPNLDAPGVIYADEHYWPTLQSIEEALHLPGLEVVIELTNDPRVTEQLYRQVPKGVRIIDHMTARLFWDIFEFDQQLVAQFKEKQQLQKQVETERKNLQQILDSLPHVVMVVDPDLRITWSNRRFNQVTGLATAQAVGEHCYKAFCRKLDRYEIGEDLCPCRKVMKTGEQVTLTKERISGGIKRYYEITASPIKDENGKIVQIVETSQEITTLKEMIQTTQEQQQLFENFMQTASDFFAIKDMQGRYLVINNSFAQFFGKTPSEFIGRDDQEVLPQDIALMMEYGDQQVKRLQADLCYTDTFLHQGKECTLLTTRFPLRDYEGTMTGVCSISRDVTEERRLQNQLLQSERLAAVGRAIGGLAHDIKNILNGLQGGQYVLDYGVENEDIGDIKKGKRMLERNISRISDMIRNMLAYSKDRKPVFTLVNPRDLVSELCETVSANLDDHGITFICDNHCLDQELYLDGTQLYRVLTNFVSNAIDACNEKVYTDEDGPIITISACPDTHEQRNLMITVMDNGIGMTEKVKKQMFEGFFSTKGSRGTGFGMPVSRKLVQEMGGRMEVESEFGKGTTLRVILPAHTEKPT